MSAKYNHRGLKARKLGKLGGKAVYRFPVTVTDGSRAAILQDAEGYARGELWVTSHTAADAAYYVRDLTWGRACIEIEVWGVKGGLGHHLYSGFESAIGQAMMVCRAEESLELFDSRALEDASRAARQARLDRLTADCRTLRMAASLSQH